MSLSLHSLAPAKGSRTKKFRVGRGLGSGRGKTSGRGTKGQRSRTGGRKRLALKGMRHMVLAFPKMKGFQSRYAKDVTVTVMQLERSFENGSVVDLDTLRAKGLATRISRSAKIVGNTALTKKLTIVGLSASASAKAMVEKAGGQFTEAKKAEAKKPEAPAKKAKSAKKS